MLTNTATQQAKAMLSKHKSKSGFAILGFPLKEILDDPKICSYLELHTQSGEDLALASLIGVLAVLIGSSTPKKSFTNTLAEDSFPRLLASRLSVKTSTVGMCLKTQIYGVNFVRNWIGTSKSRSRTQLPLLLTS